MWVKERFEIHNSGLIQGTFYVSHRRQYSTILELQIKGGRRSVLLDGRDKANHNENKMVSYKLAVIVTIPFNIR
jgi:hypothetical protein